MNKMNINSIFLILILIAAYLNLYLTLNNKRQKKKTKLPMSSKEWREKVEDENFKSWLSNRERLKDKRKGNINVQTENIFPIIKQFLYSDNEIFLWELVSNAVDATQKMKTLKNIGELNSDIKVDELKCFSKEETGNNFTVKEKEGL